MEVLQLSRESNSAKLCLKAERRRARVESGVRAGMHAFYSYSYRPQWNWIYEKIFPIR